MTSQTNTREHQEIDELDGRIRRFLSGRLSIEEFRPQRTLYGVYGQRQLDSYMVRVRVPQGRLSPEQFIVLANVADEFSQGVAHVTTRQDIEYHFVSLEDSAALLRQLADAGLTTREAGGNIVRNVTCDPLAGVCHDAIFDVTPHADMVGRHFLRNPEAQDLPRKVKIAFSGCSCDHALTWVHDIGFQAALSGEQRGFRVLVGGGLGALPRAADVLAEFVPADEIVALCQAVVRIFEREGDRKRRHRARLKFVLERVGIDSFRELVQVECAKLAPEDIDDRPWADLEETPPVPMGPGPPSAAQRPDHDQWLEVCVTPQKQSGFATVSVALPGGKVTAAQLRALARISRAYAVRPRATIEQNIVLRWTREEHLSSLHAALAKHGLAEPTAGTILDPVACPGTQTCASGITNSKALARALTHNLGRSGFLKDALARDIKLKMSGCTNACGHHHVADIGLHGGLMHVGDRLLPTYHMMVNANGFAQHLARVPARRVPEAIDTIIGAYRSHREPGESFRDFLRRVGPPRLRAAIEHLLEPPVFEEDPEAYFDWEAAKTFSLDERGEGECAV